MGNPAARFVKVNDGDRIIAYAKWNVPVRPDEPPAASRSSSSSSDPNVLPSWPDDADKALCDRFFGELVNKRKEVMQERPHYCRSCIFPVASTRKPRLTSQLPRLGDAGYTPGAPGPRRSRSVDPLGPGPGR